MRAQLVLLYVCIDGVYNSGNHYGNRYHCNHIFLFFKNIPYIFFHLARLALPSPLVDYKKSNLACRTFCKRMSDSLDLTFQEKDEEYTQAFFVCK